MTSPERMDAFEALVRATSQEVPLDAAPHAALHPEPEESKQKKKLADQQQYDTSAAATASEDAAAGSPSKPSVQPPSKDVRHGSPADGVAEVNADVDVSQKSPSKAPRQDTAIIATKTSNLTKSVDGKRAGGKSPTDGSPKADVKAISAVDGGVGSPQFKVKWGNLTPADLLLLLSPTVASSVKVKPTGGGPYVCGACENRFPSLNALDDHDHSRHGTRRHGFKDVNEFSPGDAGLPRGGRSASVLVSRHLRSHDPRRPFRQILPLRFRSPAFALYFRPADHSYFESSPMAARSSSRLLALAGRAVFARLAPAAPASALLAANVARGFATAAPAEEDVVKAAFIKQQASFRSYLEGLKKVPIPLDAADDKATKAYAAAMKNIRESLGIPSFTEKLSNLLESAEEDSRDVRSFLEESRIIRRQLGVEDKLGAEKLMFAALDSVEKKLGKALVGDDAKGMALFQEEVNAINKKLGLKDSDLEPLEQQLETSMAKTDIAAFAKEATEKIGTYKKRDGLEDIQVDLKTLDPKAYIVLLLVATVLMLVGIDGHASAQKLCLDSSQPQTPKDQLQICRQYNNESCCTNDRNVQIAKNLLNYSNAMGNNPAAKNCLRALELVLCAECDPYASQVYRRDHTGRYADVPYLCTAQSNRDPVETQPFCSTVWDVCGMVAMPFNPFVATNDPRYISLYDVYLTKGEFCRQFMPPNKNPGDGPKICYRGKPVDYPDEFGEDVLPPVSNMCVEQIGLSTKNDKSEENSYYVAMTPHPDQSRRAFFLERAGRLFLYDLPEPGSSDKLPSDGGSPFLDISGLVAQDAEQGAVGIAFHPDYTSNGRLFVSFTCDSSVNSDCKAAMCGCYDAVDCTADKVKAANPDGRWGTGDLCRNVTVVAEFSACSDTICTPSKISKRTSIEATIVRYIVRLGQPFINNNGGQIRFGADGMLYVMAGDGGGELDPLNLAQNPKAFHGKVLRLDVLNGISQPGEDEIRSRGLLGAYGIPLDNPHALDWDWRGEVFALGFHDPWKCTFDLLRPSVMMCGDVGWTKWEEVDVVTSGGNYGWKWYEGREYANASEPHPVPNQKLPSFQYVWRNTTSVVGGFYARGYEDACLYGRCVIVAR
ncbi:unnamed protein product [Closterium sp. Yama58-4]|nr:unnamed protein product [Closterium sp. Yama58-4]